MAFQDLPAEAVIQNGKIVHTIGNVAGTYRIRVKEAGNGSRPAGAIASGVFTFTPAPLLAPSDLTAGSTSGSSIELHWTNNSTDADLVSIERQMNDGEWTEYTTVSGTINTYSDTGVNQDIKYAYRVRSKKSVVYSDYSNISRSAIVYAYDLDGTGDNLTFAHSTALDFERTSPFTVLAWVMFPTIGDHSKRLFAKYDNATNRGITIFVNTSGFLQVLIRNGTANQISITATEDTLRSSKFFTNKWYCIAVTSSGSSTAAGVDIWLDGKWWTLRTIAGNNLSATIKNTKQIAIGSDSDQTLYSRHQQALTRVYNRALSAAEIEQEYNKGLPLYNSPLTGKVLEMKVNSDVVVNSKFVVQETALNANGSSNGLTASQKILVYNLDAIAATDIQKYTGNKMVYNTFGNAGDLNTTGVGHSPFTDRSRNTIWYISTLKRSYISWMQQGYIGWNREGMLLYIDHQKKIASPSYEVGFVSPGTIDGHPFRSLVPDSQGRIISAGEDVHNSPIYFSRSTDANITKIETLGNVGAQLSYNVFNKIGNTIYMFARGGGPSNSDLQADFISKSTDDGTTWSTPKMVLTLNESTGTDRAYYLPVYDTTELSYVIHMREDTIGKFTRIYYIKSADGDTFQNVNGCYSKYIPTLQMSRIDMDTNCLVAYENDNDIHVKAVVKTPNKTPVLFTNSSVNNYQVIYWNGSAWVKKPLNLPLYTVTTGDYWVVYPYSETRFVWFRVEARGGFNVIVKYETLNFFDTWDAGTIISETNKNYEQIQGTYNLNSEMNVIAASEVGTESNNIFIYEFTP